MIRFGRSLGMSMQMKMSIVFVFLVIIPIIATGYISYENYIRSINKNTKNYVAEVVAKMQGKLDDAIADMNSISKVPLYAESLQQYLAHQSMDLEKQRQIDFYIGLMNNLRKDKYNVYLFDNFGNSFYRLRTEAVRSDLQEHSGEWGQLAQDAKGDPVVLGMQKVQDTNGGTMYVFTLVRNIMSTATLESVGTIVVDGDIGLIDNVISELDSVTKGRTVILDRDDRVLYDADRSRIGAGEPLSGQIIGNQGSFDATLDGKKYICTYTVSEVTGWKMLVYVPVDYLYSDAAKTRDATMTATSAIIGFALLVSVLIAYGMTRSLRRMARMMKEVQGGKLDVVFPVRTKDEVGLVGTEFNRMLRRIEKLIDEIYDISARKKEVELDALQSQINPHFIYNTLETIRMNAELSDAEEVAEMTFTLGKLLRYSINRGREIVPLREELQHLENYVQLLGYRFKNRFALRIDVPERLMNLQVMKLLFQPLVENAVLHGVEGKEGFTNIVLTAREDDGEVLFVLRDEGVGMDGSKLALLRGSIEGAGQTGADRGGVGLRNIHERVKLHYGEAFGLEIDSRPGEGTEVRLRLPSQEEEKKHA